MGRPDGLRRARLHPLPPSGRDAPLRARSLPSRRPAPRKDARRGSFTARTRSALHAARTSSSLLLFVPTLCASPPTHPRWPATRGAGSVGTDAAHPSPKQIARRNWHISRGDDHRRRLSDRSPLATVVVRGQQSSSRATVFVRRRLITSGERLISTTITQLAIRHALSRSARSSSSGDRSSSTPVGSLSGRDRSLSSGDHPRSRHAQALSARTTLPSGVPAYRQPRRGAGTPDPTTRGINRRRRRASRAGASRDAMGPPFAVARRARVSGRTSRGPRTRSTPTGPDRRSCPGA